MLAQSIPSTIKRSHHLARALALDIESPSDRADGIMLLETQPQLISHPLRVGPSVRFNPVAQNRSSMLDIDRCPTERMVRPMVAGRKDQMPKPITISGARDEQVPK